MLKKGVNLIEYSDNYSKTSGSLWQYCKDIPTVNNGEIVDFDEDNLTDSFNFKPKTTGQTKEIEIMVPLKQLSNFWRTLERPLASTDVANQGATFETAKTKLYFPVVTLSTQDNAKLLQQLK